MSTDLQASGGSARVIFVVGPDSQTGWTAALEVSAPQRYTLEPVIERIGDEYRLTFSVSGALLGKSYDLIVTEEDGDQVTVASGVIVAGTAALRLELPDDFDTPRITVGDEPPADPQDGDIWAKTNEPTIFVGAGEPVGADENDIWIQPV